jgi:serine protease Do
MTVHDNHNNREAGILSRHRKRLTIAAIGICGVGVIAGNLVAPLNFTPAFAQSQSQASPAPPFSFADIAQKVRPAVVSIKVRTENTSSDNGDGNEGMPPDPFRFFFKFNGQGGTSRMPPNVPRKEFGMGLGSGFFISSDGYIVTNNHVVSHATEVKIVTDGGKTYTAKVVGADERSDLALLKVDSTDTFPFVQLETEHEPRVGDWVLAVGNPYGLGGTVTAGIVSARGRDINSNAYDDFLQIDAPVNRGNSGGPTFDLEGKVVGVNTAIFSPSGGGSIGIGFDIPAETVARVMPQLKSEGKVTRGYIGVQIQPVTQDLADSIGLKKAAGALVANVTNDSPAAKAGVQPGDTITAVNGKDVADSRALARIIADIKPGDAADLTVWRDGKNQDIKVTTEKLPSEKQLAENNSSQNDSGGGASLAGLGLSLAPAETITGAGNTGVVVTDVDPNGKAADELQPGDVILDVAGKPVNNVEEVRQLLSQARSDNKSTVLLRVKNDSGQHFVALPIGKA